MKSAFLVNDLAIGIPNPSEIIYSIEGVTSAATRTDSGDLTTLTKVNSILKMNIKWDYLSIEDMEILAALFSIDIPQVGSIFMPKTIEQLRYKITTRAPAGVRSFTAYVGDTFTAQLVDNSGQGEPSTLGGAGWVNVSMSLVGTGEGYEQL